MSPVQLGLAAIGLVLLVLGGWRARDYWGRYRVIEAREANIRRYEAWRGGRAVDDEGPSTAEMLAQELRRDLTIWGVVAAAGIALIVVALLIG
jgi:hypothetical protein